MAVTSSGQVVDRSPTVARQPRPPALALLVGLRPRQWVKNVLVLAAPAAAGLLTDPAVLGPALMAGVAFCLAASGTYLLNDVADREADRRHPVKRHRPIAAGELDPRIAVVAAVMLFVSAGAVAAWVSAPLLAVLAGYVALTTTYSGKLKHIPIVDLVAVAAGFVLRAVAGGVAADVELSPWFLVVASFGALYLIAGKRHAELKALGDGGGAHRATLAEYSTAYTQLLVITTAAVTLLAYCLWAFEDQGRGGGLWTGLSVGPFVIAVLRYALLVDRGQGGDPVETMLGDRELRWAVVVCAALVVVGVHGV